MTVLLVTSALAAEPLLEKKDLFTAGADGYALYRIPGIVVTKKGTVLAYCEARRTGKSDWDTIDILLRRSTDGGKTWGPPQHIAHLGERLPRSPVALEKKLGSQSDQTVNNPVAIVDRHSGAVHFLYCVEYARCFYLRSDDDGVSFRKPVEITSTFEKFRPAYDWKVLATGPGHGIQLKSGRLVVPVWLSAGTGGGGHRPSVTATIYSDDGGKSWRAGEVAVPNTAEWINPNETVVVELADGRVMLNVRSESKPHRRLVVTSPDGATGWSTPRLDAALLEPICMASIVRFSARPDADKNRILFANPHNLSPRPSRSEAPGQARERRNLSVKLSYDEGQTWPVNKVLEEGPSAYSDLAVLPDGTVLCFYERQRQLTLARFNLEWLTDGKETLPPGGAAKIPGIDLSEESRRHVVVARGTEQVYQGHPTTLLMPDGKTMFCVWTYGHGGACGPMKRSDDGGLTWSDLLPVPENWTTVRNCPAIYRLSDPTGKTRLFVFAGQGPDGPMQTAHSDDEGKTWSEMRSTGLKCVMPFCAIVPIEGGKKLLGLTNIRRPGETKEKRSNVVAQSISGDGGFTWSPWRILLDGGSYVYCEPALVRSPGGKQILCLMRENAKAHSAYMTTDDEGRTWSEAKPLPAGLVGDRHMPRYAADGRLVVCFRDRTKAFGTSGHFVAWVGRYEDIVNGREGQCRVKLLHSYAGGDCGYPGLERLPDGTFVATTYIKYKPGPEKQSVVSVRFHLDEIDARLSRQSADGTRPMTDHR